jgi:hypothetical protein
MVRNLVYTSHSISLVAGDVLEIMEQRHDWAKMTFTPQLFKYVFTELIPEVIVHSKSQDEEQVRDHYDRAYHFILSFNDLPSMISVCRRR